MILQTGQRKPKVKEAYGVPQGSYVGQILCFIEHVGDDYRFLSLPKMVIVAVPKDKFDFAIENDIMEFIEVLPDTVYKVVQAQYKRSKHEERFDDDRREQPSVPLLVRGRVDETERDGRSIARSHVSQRFEKLPREV